MFDDPIPIQPDPPTRDGRGVRFGCGFVFGLVAFLYVFRYRTLELRWALLAALAVGVAVGVVSAVQGDCFWFKVMEYSRWRHPWRW